MCKRLLLPCICVQRTVEAGEKVKGIMDEVQSDYSEGKTIICNILIVMFAEGVEERSSDGRCKDRHAEGTGEMDGSEDGATGGAEERSKQGGGEDGTITGMGGGATECAEDVNEEGRYEESIDTLDLI